MLRALELHFAARSFWLGKTLLLTSGPTEESIDPVRFMTNGSSGRMGEAIAVEAEQRGASIHWVRGPLRRADRAWSDAVQIVSVRSASEMHAASIEAMPNADLVIAAAAVSDLCPTAARSQKIPKSELSATIDFEPTPDILQDLAKLRVPGQVIIGFALEAGEGLSSAKNKLIRKGADAIVLNYETDQTGMNSSTNQITLVTESREEQGPLETKAQVASRILDWVERFATKN